MIKQFDKVNLKSLRADIDSALLQIRQKHGVSLQLGTIRFDSVKATARLTMIAVGDASAATDPRAARTANQQNDFKLYAGHFGLQAEQLGATFTYGRETYKLVGLNPNAPKWCIIASRAKDGKTFRLPEEAVSSLQSKEYKADFGIGTPSDGTCSNANAWGTVNGSYQPIGKCSKPATTTRGSKGIFGGKAERFCADCAKQIDDARAENEAEARCS